MQRDTLTVAEAAALTGVSADTVKRKIKRGQLSAVKIGKAYQVSRADLGGEYMPVDAQILKINSLLQDLIAPQIQELAARIEQHQQDMNSLHTAVSALVTKAVN